MKLQDLYPYDSTIVGLNGIYHTVGEESYYINCPRCVLTTNNIITTGKTYLFVDTNKETGVIMSICKLLNAFYEDGIVNLNVQDLTTCLVKQIPIDVYNNEHNFLMISWDDIRKMVLAENNTNHTIDDLLEFDF
jgi:hypothetical protein